MDENPSPETKAVHAVLLKLTDKAQGPWDADQRWAYAQIMAEDAITTFLNTQLRENHIMSANRKKVSAFMIELTGICQKYKLRLTCSDTPISNAISVCPLNYGADILAYFCEEDIKAYMYEDDIV